MCEATVNCIQTLCVSWPHPRQGRGSPGAAQTAAESWSCIPTSLGHRGPCLTLSAPAPSTASVIPLLAQESWYPLSLLQRWADPLPLALPPCSCQMNPHGLTRGPVAWKGLSLLHSTWHWLGLDHGNIPTRPSRALGRGRGRDKVAPSISAQPLLRNAPWAHMSPSPQEPVATSTDEWESRAKGEAVLSPQLSCGTHCVHPLLWC